MSNPDACSPTFCLPTFLPPQGACAGQNTLYNKYDDIYWEVQETTKGKLGSQKDTFGPPQQITGNIQPRGDEQQRVDDIGPRSAMLFCEQPEAFTMKYRDRITWRGRQWTVTSAHVLNANVPPYGPHHVEAELEALLPQIEGRGV